MLKLWKIINAAGTVRYFDRKENAKSARNAEWNQGNESATVKRGPDHWKGETA